MPGVMAQACNPALKGRGRRTEEFETPGLHSNFESSLG